MASTHRTHFMDRSSIVERVAYHLANEYGAETAEDADVARRYAEDAVDALIGDATLFPTERWDEDCHRCEQRIGDHLVDGRCPPDKSFRPFGKLDPDDPLDQAFVNAWNKGAERAADRRKEGG